jgi:hypothetical protein
VNTWRDKKLAYFVLHISKCPHISSQVGIETGAYTERSTIKVASDNLDVLGNWFNINYTKFTGQFDECKTCNPLIERYIHNSMLLFADTVEDKNNILFEGTKKQISVNAYERNLKARQQCLDYYGYECSVCFIDFFKTYGIGEDFIHVHHLKEISAIGKSYKIIPIEDLRPVCPNCHSMLHQKNPCYTIDELKQLMAENKR